MKTVKQKYTKVALQFIEEVNNKNNPSLKEKYLSRMKKIPSMITHNGLMSTLTFLYSKAKGDLEKEADGIILRQLVQFLKNPFEEHPQKVDLNTIQNFIRDLAEGDFKDLILHSKRAVELSQWLKRLAEGTFEKGEE